MNSHQNWECGITRVMDAVSGKWKLKILWVIYSQPNIRFNRLLREVDGVTKMTLTRSLNHLISYGLVIRCDLQTMPLHVEYSLTAKGKELFPLLLELNQWGENILKLCPIECHK